MTEEKQLEEQADILLAQYAKKLGTSQRKLGILDRRTLRRIAARELPLSLAIKKRDKDE